ncbi:MAG: diguanylate cyclase [Oscillospiraceae bacterium]|nr:diguanylate cyclase [Oscillospiraceae bacterium]
MKVKTMLIVSMAIFSLSTMFIFSLVSSIFLTASAGNRYRDMMKELSVKQASSLEMYLNSYTQRLLTISSNPAIVDYINYIETSGEDVIPYINYEYYQKALDALEALTHESSGIMGVAIFNEENDVVLSVGNDQRDFIISNRRERLGENQFAIIPGDFVSVTNQGYELLHYTKISDSHYMASSFDSSDIDMFLNRSRLPTNGKVVLVCPLHNLVDQTFRGNLDEGSMGVPEYITINSYIKEGQEGRYRDGSTFFSYEVGANNFTALFDNVGDTDWLLGVIASSDDMYVHSGNSIKSLVNCVVFVGLAMLALIVLFTLRFTKPLLVISRALTKIRYGNHEIRMSIKSGNEYGEMAKEFNDLLDNVVVGEGRYATVVEMCDNIIFEWNFKADEVTFSNNFNKRFPYRAPDNSYEESFLVKGRVHPDDAESYKGMLQRLKKGENIHHEEFRWKNIFGDYIWVLLRSCPIKGANDEVVKMVGVIIDIDRAKKSEKILSARASYDALTGLFNRETLEGLIENEMQLLAARKNEFAILFVDVDDFKFFNDNYSHATGDQVLRFTALTINDIVSKFGMAGRFGGDEFVVGIRNSEINDPASTAELILARLAEGFVCDVGDRLSVKVSIGIAIIRDTSKTVEDIIGMADEAMYNIKKSGKSNYGFIN